MTVACTNNAHKTDKPRRPFGQGIFTSPRPFEPTAADREWLCQHPGRQQSYQPRELLRTTYPDQRDRPLYSREVADECARASGRTVETFKFCETENPDRIDRWAARVTDFDMVTAGGND